MPQEVACKHGVAERARRICSHLLKKPDQEFIGRFTGSGIEYELLCHSCAKSPDGTQLPLLSTCEDCSLDFEREWQEFWTEFDGEPQLPETARSLRFSHESITLPRLGGETLVDIQPIATSTGSRWVALTKSHQIRSIDLSARTTAILAKVPADIVAEGSRAALQLSADGTFAAVFDAYGDKGVVFNLANGTIAMPLQRDGYCSHISYFPVAFATLGSRTILVHATKWDRLEISDPATDALLTGRMAAAWQWSRTAQPAHYNGAFWGRLCVSPGQEWIASSTWQWQPTGVVEVWSLRRWLEENPWESDDGPSKFGACWRENEWEDPVCWIDDRTLAVWGYGPHSSPIPAVRLFDVPSGRLVRWFPGPDVAADQVRSGNPGKERGAARWGDYPIEPYPPLLFDRVLFSLSKTNGASAWDVDTGERLARDGDFKPDRYHPGTKEFLTVLPGGAFRLSQLC